MCSIKTPNHNYNMVLKVQDFCVMPSEQFFSYNMVRTSYTQLNDDDVHFILDQHA